MTQGTVHARVPCNPVDAAALRLAELRTLHAWRDRLVQEVAPAVTLLGPKRGKVGWRDVVEAEGTQRWRDREDGSGGGGRGGRGRGGGGAAVASRAAVDGQGIPDIGRGHSMFTRREHFGKYVRVGWKIDIRDSGR